MSHPRNVFCLASCLSPTSFLKESGSSHSRGSDGCSCRKSVWVTNRAALFARYIQCFSSTVMVIMSLMNPSIYASVSVISTAKGYVVSSWIVECCLYSYGSKDMCGEFRSSVSQAFPGVDIS